MPIISVVMAAYNGERYIKEQLDSIIGQTVVPDQIIIIDDCSKDNTWNILQNYKKKNSDKIMLYKNSKNVGVLETFKRCLRRSDGDYIFLCDQDDIWEKNKIEICLSIATKMHAQVLTTGMRLIDAKGAYIEDINRYKSDPVCGYDNWTNEIYRITLDSLVWGNFTPGCTYCIKRDIVYKFLEIDNNEILHDFQLLLVAANRGKAFYYDYPLIRYRLHNENAVGMNNKEKKRKRHIKPRIVRFLDSYSVQETIENRKRIGFLLYLRLPKIRSIAIRKLGLVNDARKKLEIIPCEK